MNKQKLFGFVVIAVTAIMITSQMPEAFAADRTCINETLTGNLGKTNIIVPTQSTFNICVLDGVSLKQGNIFVQANAAVYITGGTDVKGGDINLQGSFASVNFERSNPTSGKGPSILDGNIFGVDNTYIFLDHVTVQGNVATTGEFYMTSQPSRHTGPTKVVGNISVDLSDNTNEFVIAGGEVTGTIKVFSQLTVRVFDATIGSNLEVLDSVNTSADGLILVENNNLGGLKLQRNTITTVLLKDNTISSGLNIQDNPSDVELDGNTVDGNAVCKDNSSVFGNTIFNGKGKNQCTQFTPT